MTASVLIGDGSGVTAATRLGDSRHPGSRASTEGNLVQALWIHGADVLRRARPPAPPITRAGDLIMFTDWRGDPDERPRRLRNRSRARVVRSRAPGVVVGDDLAVALGPAAVQRGAEPEPRSDINRAGGECIRDMRVRPGGSHHQKFVVVRHAHHPERDVAFVGGIDLCHSRRDTAEHLGDPQRQPMSDVYGPRPPWHDVQLEVRGPAVGDLEFCFRERWDDPTPVSLNPAYRLADGLRKDDDDPSTLPDQGPDPAPTGAQVVQLLRTYPAGVPPTLSRPRANAASPGPTAERSAAPIG